METAIQTTSNNLAVMPVVDVRAALARYQAMKEFIDGILHEGVDFGVIPGTGTKKVLLKPGAEKFSFFFGLRPQFVDIATIEDWTGKDHNGEPFFYYRVRCELYRDGQLVASADGSCNSWEKKYRYRKSERVCPVCSKPTIITGKAEYGGGYICYAKKGGCGAKFKAGDPAIEGQQVGEIKNPDIAEQVNTILKMAQKRALVAAVLIGANASEWFTQDIEDFTDAEYTEISTIPTVPVDHKTGEIHQAPISAKIMERWNELAAEAAVLGLKVPDISGLDEEALIQAGKEFKARIEKAKAEK